MSRELLRIDADHEACVESQLLEAAAALQKTVLVLGSPGIRRWFNTGVLARAQEDVLEVQVAVLAKLQRLNARSLECLHESPGICEIANRHPIDNAARVESAKRGCCERDPEFRFLRRREDGPSRD